MIIGAHMMLQSRNPTADRAFFGGVLNLPSVDAGGGFMIFGVPPAEVAIHDSERNDIHQLYLMCADANRFIREMERIGIACTTPAEQRWGKAFEITLPGGGRLGVYEPRHARPAGKATTKSRTKTKRRPPAKRKSAAARKAKTKKAKKRR
jgi:hypothetical protein